MVLNLFWGTKPTSFICAFTEPFFSNKWNITFFSKIQDTGICFYWCTNGGVHEHHLAQRTKPIQCMNSKLIMVLFYEVSTAGPLTGPDLSREPWAAMSRRQGEARRHLCPCYRHRVRFGRSVPHWLPAPVCRGSRTSPGADSSVRMPGVFRLHAAL